MAKFSRRDLGLAALYSSLFPLCGILFGLSNVNAQVQQAGTSEVSADAWMREWQASQPKDFKGPLDLRRFKDPVYILLDDVDWTPPSNRADIHPVHVPKGFVTDFASVPRPFWSLFRPDGDYAYAAVLHDFLYWNQDREKHEADEVFRLAMNDLKITDRDATILYEAVNRFGESAWEENTKLKAAGERRVLRILPEKSDVTWAEWKRDKSAFEGK